MKLQSIDKEKLKQVENEYNVVHDQTYDEIPACIQKEQYPNKVYDEYNSFSDQTPYDYVHNMTWVQTKSAIVRNKLLSLKDQCSHLRQFIW